MPRPPIERSVSPLPRVRLFKPAGMPSHELEQLALAVDELEAIRLVDLEGLSHEQAARMMGVSRQTVGRVVERGRAKVAEALVTGKAIVIGGGQYRVEPRQLCCTSCDTVWATDAPDPSSAVCPSCGEATAIMCWNAAGHCGRGRRHGKGACRRRRAPGHGQIHSQPENIADTGQDARMESDSDE